MPEPPERRARGPVQSSMSKWIIGALLVLSALWGIETLGDAGHTAAAAGQHGGPTVAASDADLLDDHVGPPAPLAGAWVPPSPVWLPDGTLHEQPRRSPGGVRIRQPARGPPASPTS